MADGCVIVSRKVAGAAMDSAPLSLVLKLNDSGDSHRDWLLL